MAILIPAKSLTGPQGGATGILAGILQGLAQGMPIGEQMRARRVALGQGQQKIDLEKGQLARKNAQEDSSRKMNALLAEWALSDSMGGGGAAPQNGSETQADGMGAAPPSGPVTGAGGMAGGPTLPGPEEPPSTTGAGGMAGGPQIVDAVNRNPNAPFNPNPLQDQIQPHHERLGRLHEMVRQQIESGGLSHEQAHMVMEAGRRDESLNAVKHHAQRVVGDLQGDLDNGKFDSVDDQGHPDLSGRAAAQAAIDAVKRADPRDPKEMAKVVDAAEAANQKIKTHGALKQSAFEHKQFAGQVFESQLNDFSQGKDPLDPSIKEARDKLKLWQAGQVDDKEMSKDWPKIMNGTFELEQNKAKAETAHQEAQNKLDAIKAFWDSPEGKQAASDIEEARQKRVKLAPSAAGPEKPAPQGTPLSRIEADQKIEEMVQEKYPDLEGGGFFGIGGVSQEDKDKRELEQNNYRAQLQGKAFGQVPGRSSAPRANGKAPAPAGKDTAQSLWSSFKSGEISKEELKKRAAAAGLSPDEFKALAGAK